MYNCFVSLQSHEEHLKMKKRGTAIPRFHLEVRPRTQTDKTD